MDNKMFKIVSLLGVSLISIFLFGVSVEASHICSEEGFVYGLNISAPGSVSCAGFGGGVTLSINQCFNAPSASGTAYYDGEQVATFDFPQTGGLESSVSFSVSDGIVISHGGGTRTISVDVSTSDSCGGQSLSASATVDVACGGYAQGTYNPVYSYGQGNYLPDLISNSPSPSVAQIKAGTSVNFVSSIVNQGASDASQSRFLYSIDGLSLTNGLISSLVSGASTGASSNPWFAQGVGTHHVQVCADSGGTVSESNESNNCSSRLFQVLSPTYSYGESAYSVYSYGQSSYGSVGVSNPNCSDGVDNDADNWIDFKDLGCLTPLPNSNPPVACGEECTPNKASQCSDGKDNDGDGKIDGFDSNCENASDNTERLVLFIEF